MNPWKESPRIPGRSRRWKGRRRRVKTRDSYDPSSRPKPSVGILLEHLLFAVNRVPHRRAAHTPRVCSVNEYSSGLDGWNIPFAVRGNVFAVSARLRSSEVPRSRPLITAGGCCIIIYRFRGIMNGKLQRSWSWILPLVRVHESNKGSY